MPHSHHSHSGQFCRHAKDSLEQVIQEAVRQKFKVFGLSEHAPRYRLQDLFPEESDLSPQDLESAYLDFLHTASKLKQKYKDQISLLIGLETDYITPIDLEQTRRLLEHRKEIDYIVGSVHHVNGISIDFDKPTWTRCVQSVIQRKQGSTMTLSPNGKSISFPGDLGIKEPTEMELGSFLLAYLDAQYEMLQYHQPEVIGHFDLCLLWVPDLDLTSLKMEAVRESIKRNVEYGIGYGALFEANAAAIRKGWKTSYPNPYILKLILDLGGKVCLSDDSHGVSYVGLNYGKMREYLVQQGVKEVYHLVRKDEAIDSDLTVGSRDRVKARRVNDWAEDPFWRKDNA